MLLTSYKWAHKNNYRPMRMRNSKVESNIENIVITIKHLQINHILALNNP